MSGGGPGGPGILQSMWRGVVWNRPRKEAALALLSRPGCERSHSRTACSAESLLSSLSSLSLTGSSSMGVSSVRGTASEHRSCSLLVKPPSLPPSSSSVGTVMPGYIYDEELFRGQRSELVLIPSMDTY